MSDTQLALLDEADACHDDEPARAADMLRRIDPSALPESRLETVPVGPFEIIVVANDPDHLETGRIRFEITGGRR